MNSFISATLANLIGSLLAGGLLAWGVFFFVTQKLEIVKPREERIREQLMVCDLLIGELNAGKEFASAYIAHTPTKERLQMHAWEAVKGSQAIRFLSVNCVQPILKAYADLYELEALFLAVEQAQMREWTTGDPAGKSRAALLGKQLALGVAIRLERVQKSCAEAMKVLTLERERLQAP
jgi:hypothetical protein